MNDIKDWNNEPWILQEWPTSAMSDREIISSESGRVLSQWSSEGMEIGQGDAARAVSCVNACARLSLPSDVPVGALREVVEALQGFVDVCDNGNPMQFVTLLGNANQAAILALAKLNPSPTTEEK